MAVQPANEVIGGDIVRQFSGTPSNQVIAPFGVLCVNARIGQLWMNTSSPSPGATWTIIGPN